MSTGAHYPPVDPASFWRDFDARHRTREAARGDARTPEQKRQEAHDAAWQLHETCAKSGESGCQARDGHLCRPSGPRPGPLHGQRDPLWRDSLIGGTS